MLTMTSSFGHWLKQQRRSLDLTQDQLAEQIGCSSDLIRKIESGTRRPSRFMAERLAHSLQIAPENCQLFVRYARDDPRGTGAIERAPAQAQLCEAAEDATARAQCQSNHLAPPTLFIGRAHELVAAKALLCEEQVRLLTLTGPGGVGKTRLSLLVAADLLPRFVDGVFVVSLAPIRTPDLVLPAIAEVLGVRETGAQPLIERLKAWLRDRQTLLVLDNFEQVIAAAPLVADLLIAAPRLKILTTSRELLRISGERRFLVPPLALPNFAQRPAAEQVIEYEAVRLFIERAKAAEPDFQVTNANAPAVAEICYRLDGLPLAIELAAARIRLLPPQPLLARLGNRLALLTHGARDLPARQQTLRRTIDWSYDLLDMGEQQLFRRLAVFMGGRTLKAIEAVCNAEGDLSIDVLDGLTSLLDKSLLYQDRQVAVEGGEPRFMMLETIWEYATECLTASGERELIRQQHAAYYLDLAERAALELRGPNQLSWLDQLEQEQGNLRAALEWAASAGQAERGAQTVIALLRFWEVRGHLSEGRQWYDIFLAMQRQLAPGLLARLLNAAARMAFNQSDYARSNEWYQQGLDLAQLRGDQLAGAAALNGLGTVARSCGEFGRAATYYAEALPIWRASGDQYGVATSLLNLGTATRDQGYYPRAGELLEESLRLYRGIGDTRSIALVLDHLAVTAHNQGDYARAMALQDECLALRRALRDKRGTGASLCDIGNLALDQGDLNHAIALYEESLALFREVGEQWAIARLLDNLGYAWQRKGEYTRSGAFHDEGLQIQRALGDKHGAAMSLANIGMLALRQGDLQGAAAALAESLTLRQAINDRSGIWSTLDGLAEVAFALHQPERAAWIFGAASGLRAAIGDSIAPANLPGYEQMVAALRAALGVAAFEAAWAAGRALPLNQAVAAALAQKEP